MAIFEKSDYATICQSCVYKIHPLMLTTYSIKGYCDRCGQLDYLAIVKKNTMTYEEKAR